jgi:hypothetical protein
MNFNQIKFILLTIIVLEFCNQKSSNAQQIYKLALSPQNVVTETNCGNAYYLFEEQTLAGDPKNGNGGNIINLYNNTTQTYNTWECGSSSSVQLPAYSYIDLGKIHVITDIYLRDVNNSGKFSIYSGYPGSWELILSDKCKGYNSWNAHHINNKSTRYLRFKKDSDGAKIAEIVVYGYDPNPLLTDTIKPSAITDLKIDSTSKNSVFLSWTAPRDNSDSIAFYELRYSNMLITNQNFSNAKKIDSICHPQPYGTKVNFQVNNLQSGTPYYFTLISADFQQNFSLISNVVTSKTKLDLLSQPYQIILEPDMIINEFAIGKADKSADEQFLFSDTLNNLLSINSFWNLSENNSAQTWHYPISVLIDLGTEYNITSTAIFNSGTIYSAIKVYYNNLPFQNRDSANLTLDTTKIWKKINNQVFNNTRYIRLLINTPNTKIGEIALWGKPILNYTETVSVENIQHKNPQMNDFIGINGFINEAVGKLNCAGFIREFHDWIWNEGNNNSINYPYQKHAIEWDVYGGYWDFDNFYENINNQGLTICPAIQNSVSWLTNYNNNLLQSKPLDSTNLNASLPSSYKNHANFMYQIAARYGSKIIADNKLQLAADQDRFSGKNWLKYVENWNEPNKWWKGRAEYFSPYEFAAMSSADYDGHEATLFLGNHNNLGLKNADSSAKLVMGGLAEGTIDYLKTMRFWSLNNRNDKKIPFDVINIHQYFYALKNNAYQGISPEEYGIKAKMLEIVKFRDKYMPGKEIWLSEFGYNTTANTFYSVPIIGNNSREETQGRWIVRTYLELAASGIDKAILYKLSNDEQDNNTGNTYGSSGITSKKSMGYIPKPAWYYVSTLKNNLNGFRFYKEIQSGNNNISVYQFKHDSTSALAYTIWSPTSTDQIISNYQLQIPLDYSYAKQIQFENGLINGLKTDCNIINNKINLTITEKPIIIIASTDSIFPNLQAYENKIILDSNMVFNESNMGNANLLVDEQIISGDPFMGNAGNPVTNWRPSTKASDYPVSAYLDLGYERNISQLYLYDATGIGDISLSYGSPDNWTVFYTESLDQYLSWRCKITNIKTRYIRITLYNTANMNELIIYEK